MSCSPLRRGVCGLVSVGASVAVAGMEKLKRVLSRLDFLENYWLSLKVWRLTASGYEQTEVAVRKRHVWAVYTCNKRSFICTRDEWPCTCSMVSSHNPGIAEIRNLCVWGGWLVRWRFASGDAQMFGVVPSHNRVWASSDTVLLLMWALCQHCRWSGTPARQVNSSLTSNSCGSVKEQMTTFWKN